jgi:secreted trypsin-like serine protease
MKAITAALACILVLGLAGAARAGSGEPEIRVVGGSETAIEAHPHQVALALDAGRFSGDDFDRQFCGGSLITPRVVQTAAHCLVGNDPDNGGMMDANDLDVVAGRAVLSSSAGQRIDVLGSSVDPGYEDSTADHDAAWIVLAAPAAPPAAPIAIAGPDEAPLWTAGRMAQISGWGTTTSGGSSSDELRAAAVPITADSACDALGGMYEDFDPLSMVCAGFDSGGVDTCQGDSGGPLAVPGMAGTTRVLRLVGITSWGDGCAEPKAPGVYTRIAGAAYNPFAQQAVDQLESSFSLPDGGSVYGSGATVPPAATPSAIPTATTSGEVGTHLLQGKRKKRCKQGKRLKRGRCVAVKR